MKTAAVQVQRSDPLRDQVYQALHRMLAEGALDAGARLTETQLAAQLGVSRTPVREALARLRQEGLLHSTRRGASLARLERSDLEEIMEMRALLDPFIAARAAERMTPAGLAALRAALEREVAALPARSPQRFAAANQDFRLALLDLCRNRRLAETARRLDTQIQALRQATLADQANREVVVRHHRKLVAAVGRQDAREAERVMRELMALAREASLALAGERP